MFFYDFPHIRNFSEVEQIVKESDHFFVKVDEENELLIISYRINSTEVFPEISNNNLFSDSVKREFRGIKFCLKTKKILARPFHKFFNLNERVSTSIQNLDFSKPHIVMDKIDGSMIHPLKNAKGEIIWCTKLGKTEVSDKVLPLVKANPNLINFANWCFSQGEMGWTPIFEFTSNAQRIVIDYGLEPKLTLLAIRNNVTGKYMPY